MISRIFVISAIAVATGMAGPAFAISPTGLFPGGPPTAIVMGPPPGGVAPLPHPAVTDHAAAEPPATAINLNLRDADDPGIASAANLLDDLRVARATPAALEQAPMAMRDAVAAYKKATVAAQADQAKYADLVSQDRIELANSQTDLMNAKDNLTQLRNSLTPAQPQIAGVQKAVGRAQKALVAAATRLTTDEASLTAARAKVDSARNSLALAANRPLSPALFSRLDTILGI